MDMRAFKGRSELLAILAILAVVLISYSNALSGGFVMDDFDLSILNPNVKSWANLPRIFTTGYWDAEGFTRGLYRPLTITSFLVEHSIAGVRPFMYHLDNIVLHFLCSVMAYLILKELLNAGKTALIAALLFAAHPVHSEAVAWVSGRAELLSAFFALFSILVFIKRSGRFRWLILSSFFYLLSLLSKESGVVVVLLLIAYLLMFEDPRPGQGGLKHLALRIYPYLAATAIFMMLRLNALGGEVVPVGEDQAFFGVSPYRRSLTMCRALYEYTRLSFFPFNLKYDYQFPPPGSFIELKVMLPLLMIAAMLIFARSIALYSKPAMFAAICFFVTLLPVSNIIPTGIIMSERALYTPVLGACLLLGLAVSGIVRYIPAFGRESSRYSMLAVLPLLTIFTAGTLDRNTVWHDQEGFVKHYVDMLRRDIESHPGYTPAYVSLARVETRFLPYGPEMEKAVREAASRMAPDDPEAHYMLALMYQKRSMPQEALAEVQAAIRLDPQSVYFALASGAFSKLGRIEEALGMIEAAIKINPNRASFHVDKGNMEVELGEDGAALVSFRRAEALDPEDHDAYLGEGIALDSEGQHALAVERVKKAVGLRPDIPDLHYFLAVAFMDAGQAAEAKAELEAALRLKPDYRDAREMLQRLR